MKAAIKCGKLFSARDGNAEKNKVVRVEGSKITEVISAEDYKPLPGEELIDLSDKFVMPGLIDGHVHIAFGGGLSISEVNEPEALVCVKAVRNVQDDLMGGFTTVRDLGFTSVRGSQCIRDAVNKGITWGPRMRQFSPGRTNCMSSEPKRSLAASLSRSSLFTVRTPLSSEVFSPNFTSRTFI